MVGDTFYALAAALGGRDCPSCAAGTQARALVMASDFWLHLAAAAAPFALTALIAWIVDAHLKRVDARED
ncbi:MAG: hypothetical protein JWN44_4681 [Myxococcales bacterium]|nr:hypothetical protein [Myxococcales bacterium]